MLNRNFSRREFLGTTTLGAIAGASVLANPVRAAAEAVGVKPADLPDLTIKEVKVYFANLGVLRRINSPESGEIVSMVTNSGIEGNYTLGNRVSGTGWLEYAKGVCVGKSVIDLLPSLTANAARRGGGGFGGGGRGGGPGPGPGGGPNLGGRGPTGFVGGFGYPNGMKLGSIAETDYHAAIIDVCLWDILGKAMNRPIYKLLGGGTKDKMLAYASSLHLATIEDFGPQALQAKAEGFKGYKIHPGGGPSLGGRGPTGFVGGFGYPNGMKLGSVMEMDYHAAIIDVCLWDILGKAVNRPIYKLLGGTKDKMLAYASSLHLASIEDFAPQAAQAKAEGFKGYKIHPGGGQHPTGGSIPAYVGHIEEIREVRKAVGEEFTLLFDPVQRYNVFEALKVGRALEEYGYVSFEDPIPETDIEGLIELRQKLSVPIEVGEFLYGIQAYAEYIRRGALDIVRLISDNVGGISGSFRVGQLADAFGMPCTPHNWGNGFDLAVHFQLELALPNCFWFEMPYPQTLTDRAYLKDQFRIDKDGYVQAPTAPGLGCVFDRDALDKILTRIDR